MTNQAKVNDVNIVEMTSLISPKDFKESMPLSEELSLKITEHRKAVQNIIDGKDRRLLAIVGPCSIHDEKAAYDYAYKLKELSDKLSDKFLFVMRVYFEKPRTTIGWRGLVIDPHLNGSFDINLGLHKAREIMLRISEIGLPIGSEILDPIIPQYISDLISWASIGARTTESQVHREISSGLSMPVGFKNSTDGQFHKALNAIQSSLHTHSFIGIDEKGMTSICRTRGNSHAHLILRGGDNGPNYYEEIVEEAEDEMKSRGINPALVIDCSHANSGKKHNKQERVLKSVIQSHLKGHKSVKGFMLESNLFEGNQQMKTSLSELKYGVSITDACVSWESTKDIILHASELLKY